MFFSGYTLVSKTTDIFTQTIKSCVKSTSNYKNRTLVPWWKKEISLLRKSVNRARKKFQSTRAVDDLNNYNQYKFKIRALKSENFKTYCSTAKSPWDLVKKLTSSYKTPCIPTLKKDCGAYTISDFDTCSYLLDKWFPDDDISSENEQHKQVRVFVQSFLDKGFVSPPPITNQELKIINTISPLKHAVLT